MASLIHKVMRFLPERGPLASPLAQRVLLGLLTVAIVAFPLVVQAPPIDLKEGAPAPRTIRAPRTVQYVDEDATSAARQAAAEAVEPVVRFDADALLAARQDVASLFDTVRETRAEASQEASGAADPGQYTITRLEELLAEELPDLDADARVTAATLSAKDLATYSAAAQQLVTTIMSRRFDASGLPEAADSARSSAARLPYPAEVRDLVATVVVGALRETLVLDPTATEAARQAAAEEVGSIVVGKQAGENIIVAGTVVTEQDMEIIRRLGLLAESGSALSLVALVALCAIMVLVAGAYIQHYDAAVWASFRDLLVLAVLFVGVVWPTRLILWWRPDISIYLLPVPVAAMLATLLLSAREGMLLAVVTSLAAVMLGFSSGDTVVATMVWSLVAVVVVSYMTDRRRMFYAGGALVLAGLVVGATATLASGASARESLQAGAYGAVGGLLSAILGYGLLPFFEHIFDVTTDVKLLELANPASGLLRELMMEAPGTYNHSIQTANLAETAAQAIGANALLARVGAYYHDVGKMRRPGFFVENQAGEVNPHTDITAQMSALIIHAHVKDGIELAREHKLPKEIVDIIREHHGTSLVSYFFNKASEEDMKVREADFRYDGERPQSREAAIVMLADACEAAVRAIRKHTVPRIESTVRAMVDAKVADGQLDAADLTLSDIESIKRVYARMLAAVYHPRVEYPSATPRRQGHEHYPDHEPSRS